MLWADILPWGFPKFWQTCPLISYTAHRSMIWEIMVYRDDSTIFFSWVKRDRMHDLYAACALSMSHMKLKLVGKNDKIHYEYRTGRIQSQRHWRQVQWVFSVLFESNVLVPSVKCWILATPVENQVATTIIGYKSSFWSHNDASSKGGLSFKCKARASKDL